MTTAVIRVGRSRHCPCYGERLVSSESVSLVPIGWVRSSVATPTDEAWGEVDSTIEIEPRLRPGLRGVEAFSHVLVVAFLHRAGFDPAHHLVRRPRGLASMPEVEIFAQRAKERPNPLAITCARLLGVESEGLRVRGLDAIDGTPVLDVKPHFPAFDCPESPRVPEWVPRLMQGYF